MIGKSLKLPLVWRLVFICVIGTSVVLFFVVRNNPSTPRELWNSKGIQDYQIVVETMALPQPVIGLALTIRDGIVVERSILACDNPSELYLAQTCEPIQRYYVGLGTHTIEDLFDIGDNCTEVTQQALAACPLVIPSPNGLDSFDTMLAVADTCHAYLQDAWICSVEYDPVYGYPRSIIAYAPNIPDGYSSIQILDFSTINLQSSTSP